jgi:hypothetical protein
VSHQDEMPTNMSNFFDETNVKSRVIRRGADRHTMTKNCSKTLLVLTDG